MASLPRPQLHFSAASLLLLLHLRLLHGLQAVRWLVRRILPRPIGHKRTIAEDRRGRGAGEDHGRGVVERYVMIQDGGTGLEGYGPDNRSGSKFVDLTIISKEQKFVR